MGGALGSPPVNDSIPFTDLKPSEQLIVHYVLLHLNWLAIVLCALTIGTFVLFQPEFPRSMPLWLAVSCVVLHSVLLIGPISNYSFTQPGAEQFLCYFQGAMIQFSCVAIYCWLFLITFYLYLIVVQKFQSQQIAQYSWAIHVFAWGTPAIATAIPLLFLQFRDRGVWCWLPNTSAGAWEVGAYYGPLACLIIITTIFWALTVLRACQVSSSFKTSAYVFQTSTGMFLFILSFVLQFIHRLFNLVQNKTTYGLELVHTIFLSLMGFTVFITFCCTYDNIKSYQDLYREIFKQNEETTLLNGEVILINEGMSPSDTPVPISFQKPFQSQNLASPFRGYATG